MTDGYCVFRSITFSIAEGDVGRQHVCRMEDLNS
jgi:hypothetical protein